MIAAHGSSTGLDANQLRDLQAKQLGSLWQNAARGKFNEADDPKASLGAKIAADKALLGELQAQDKTGNYAFGGTDFQMAHRQNMISLVQNRIEQNQDRARAEARARQAAPVSAFQILTDPVQALTKANGERPVPITLANPAGALLARQQQMGRLGSKVILTSQEAEAIAGHLLKQETPRAGITWLAQLTQGLPDDVKQSTIGKMAGQIQASSPDVSRALNLFADGRQDQAVKYMEGKAVLKPEGANPAMKKQYRTIAERVRTELGTAADTGYIDNVSDVIATLVSTQQADYKKVLRDVVGETRVKGKWRPTVTNAPFIVPNGYDADRITNFFNNPSIGTANTLGTTPDIIKNSQVVFRSNGYYLKDPTTGNFVSNGDGRAVVIPFNIYEAGAK
jgi:hypothetical protein